MKIIEIFKSIQGETTLAGLPCSFVRAAGCNLRCAYCDTAYAYHGGEEMSPEEIAGRLKTMAVPLVAVTGGEPLLQRDELMFLLERLLREKFAVLLETNGSLPVDGLPAGVKIIMDIKCPGSGMSGKMLWKNVEALPENAEIKFVLSSLSDYNWARGVVRERLGGGKHEILFSPAAGLISLGEIAARIIEDNLQVRLQPQLHRIIWEGKERGV